MQSGIYSTIGSYIQDNHYKKDEYNRKYRYSTRQDEEYMNEIINLYGRLPEQEASCRYLDNVKEEFFKNIFRIESKDNTLGLVTLYKHLFYDSGVMIHLQCTLNRLFGSEVLDQVSPIWKENIHRIGDKSADGMVYTGTIGGYEDLVVFKVAKRGTENETIYENLVGHIVNKLRLEGCINFAYTYGIAECGKSDTYCQQDQLVIMQEFIEGQSASSYIKEADPAGFMDMTCQLTFSLDEAKKKYGFMHLDLHNQNVMRRYYEDIELFNRTPGSRGGEFLVPYDNGLYVKTKGIATVIDYGRSAISVNNELIISAHKFDRDGHVLSEVADMFKFLNFIYYDYITSDDRSTYNREVVTMLIAMLEFFINERVDITDTYDIEEYRDTFYVLPSTSRDKTYEDFHNHLRTHPALRGWYNRVVVTDPTDMVVLECRGNCSTPGQHIDSKRSNVITSPLDFLLRAGEDWEVNLSQSGYDQLTNDIISFVQSNRDKVPGLVDLAREAANKVKGVENQRRLREL